MHVHERKFELRNAKWRQTINCKSTTSSRISLKLSCPFWSLGRLRALGTGRCLLLALGTLRGSMVGRENSSDTRSGTHWWDSYAKPVVPRLADNCQRTTAGFSEGRWTLAPAAWKLKNCTLILNQSVSLAVAACSWNALSYASQALPWNWRKVRNIKSLYRVTSRPQEG